MLGGKRDKINFGRTKYKFRSSRNKNTVEYKTGEFENGNAEE